MKLCYRGVSHSYLSSTVLTVETETTTAKFLGKTYKVRRPVYQPHREKLNLVYRGVAYSTEKTPSVQLQSPKRSKEVAKLAAQLGI